MNLIEDTRFFNHSWKKHWKVLFRSSFLNTTLNEKMSKCWTLQLIPIMFFSVFCSLKLFTEPKILESGQFWELGKMSHAVQACAMDHKLAKMSLCKSHEAYCHNKHTLVVICRITLLWTRVGGATYSGIDSVLTIKMLDKIWMTVRTHTHKQTEWRGNISKQTIRRKKKQRNNNNDIYLICCENGLFDPLKWAIGVPSIGG